MPRGACSPLPLQSRPSLEWKPGVCEDGLGVPAFDKAFDDHFMINSELISQALEGTANDSCSSFPEKKKQPQAWGMSVGLLWKLWLYIREDLLGYAAAHRTDGKTDGKRRHKCLVDPCLWTHWADDVQPTSSGAASSDGCERMRGDMHLVVQRYVLPWTKTFDAGLALVLNAGGIAWSRKSADLFCMASTFVSHSWAEAFEDFALTLHRLLDEEAVVWICSFALWQHGDISASAGPWHLFQGADSRSAALEDHSADTLERCWVVFEAALAHELGKDYNICLPDDGDAASWRIVGHKLEQLDVEACRASNKRDKEEILSFIRKQKGGIFALNSNVRMLARQAMERSELMAAAVAGDLGRIDRATDEELLTWRNIRGRTVTHVAAACSQVAALVKVLERTKFAHLNSLDEDSRSPLGVAVESSQVASVLALLALRADIELRKSDAGHTALHLAAMHGNPDITQALVDMKGDFEAETIYNGRMGYRPITIACNEGNVKIVRLLVDSRANMLARTSTGAAALHVAAWTGHSEAAAVLLARKADVNITTKDVFQRTPLSLALMNGHSATVGLLLGAKADVSPGEEASDQDLHTPRTPATHRSRSSRRRMKKYTRKESRHEAQMLVLKHESSGSLHPSQSENASRKASHDSESQHSNVSRKSHVTFEEAADVTFFPNSSSSSETDNTEEEDFVLLADSLEDVKEAEEWHFPQRSSRQIAVLTLFAFALGIALGRRARS
ncbi:unnamed protein product [Durusdinium trenchii]|uniref:CARD- and ANK-domain containing inflammasome adapter protein n=1 Tax=Durusdinium trenchii TaxID=1381693 RepID=A0ABP0JD21_9DINO